LARAHPRRVTKKPVTSVASAIGALDAKIKLLAQRMKVIEANEQVIARTLVSHNKKLKELEAGGAPPNLETLKADIKEELKRELTGELSRRTALEGEEISKEKVAELMKELAEVKKLIVKMKQEVDEMKYVLDTVNPLEYVTIDQLDEVIDRKVREKLEKLRGT